jgi:hypothetical protein
MKIIFESFQKMVNAGGTVIFLHHTGKSTSSDYRGSSEIKAGVDCLFTLKKFDLVIGKFLILHCVKHRFVEDDFKITMKINSVDSGIALEDAEELFRKQQELEQQEKVSPLINVMNEHFEENQEYPNQSQIIERLKGQLSKDDVRETLQKYKQTFWTEERRGKNEKYYVPL